MVTASNKNTPPFFFFFFFCLYPFSNSHNQGKGLHIYNPQRIVPTNTFALISAESCRSRLSHRSHTLALTNVFPLLSAQSCQSRSLHRLQPLEIFLVPMNQRTNGPLLRFTQFIPLQTNKPIITIPSSDSSSSPPEPEKQASDQAPQNTTNHNPDTINIASSSRPEPDQRSSDQAPQKSTNDNPDAYDPALETVEATIDNPDAYDPALETAEDSH
ncbi:hypothetical protein QBC38DRAFT_169343 [Podospora fimiseda]|uniref:Uncharacterized protein n=1 Tax=Podospora fimiseda TaxID=252190 RepID=A0AAN7H592_9PEZI|nr:hypothetical protein QBC38DRAFT_169343 [Podospora fimiseda]